MKVKPSVKLITSALSDNSEVQSVVIRDGEGGIVTIHCNGLNHADEISELIAKALGVKVIDLSLIN